MRCKYIGTLVGNVKKVVTEEWNVLSMQSSGCCYGGGYERGADDERWLKAADFREHN